MSRPAQIGFLSTTASLYDPVVRALGFLPLWQEVAAVASAGAGTRCLDVCTGTGGVALALAARGARTMGIDLSDGLLARARRKARAAGLETDTEWFRMDARRMALPEASFPVVTCCMALHEMAEDERTTVLGELARVASRRIVVAEYRVPESRAARAWFRVARCFEYWESDDFERFVAWRFEDRLAASGLVAQAHWDCGPFRIWSCHRAAPAEGTPSDTAAR